MHFLVIPYAKYNCNILSLYIHSFNAHVWDVDDLDRIYQPRITAVTIKNGRLGFVSNNLFETICLPTRWPHWTQNWSRFWVPMWITVSKLVGRLIEYLDSQIIIFNFADVWFMFISAWIYTACKIGLGIILSHRLFVLIYYINIFGILHLHQSSFKTHWEYWNTGNLWLILIRLNTADVMVIHCDVIAVKLLSARRT